MLALGRHLSAMQRAVVAACLTAVLVAPFEAVSFHRGWFPGFDIAVFGIPAVIAVIFYGRMKERLLAWALLTLISLLSVVAVIIGLWMLGPL